MGTETGARDLLESAWDLMVSAHASDDQAPPGWIDRTEKWRDEYHAFLKAAPAQAAEAEPSLPEGEYATVEIMGHDSETGWVSDGTRAGVPVMVIRDHDGRVVREIPGHAMFSYIPLPTPLKRPELHGGPRALGVAVAGWDSDEDSVYDDESGGAVLMTETLPAWAEMTDLDKGAALLHLHKREWGGEDYAIENYPARYFDHPSLVALSPWQASSHAASVEQDADNAGATGGGEYMRLYNLALDAERARTEAEAAQEAPPAPGTSTSDPGERGEPYESFVAGSGERVIADIPVPPPGSGAALITTERLRQVMEEGWTAEHDAEHSGEELAIAAACYAMPANQRSMRSLAGISGWDEDIPEEWPWQSGWWKPSPDDRIRELVKAGALIAAEIDRLSAAAGTRE